MKKSLVLFLVLFLTYLVTADPVPVLNNSFEGGLANWHGRTNQGPIAAIAKGWRAEVIAEIDQSFCGWDVEIGDADNDGLNEILATGTPDSRLEFFKKVAGSWQWRTLATNLANRSPGAGMGLSVQITDLNSDGTNEIIFGTGQEILEPAYFYLLETDGHTLTKKISSRAFQNSSAWTHNFGVHDIDGDGVKEVISAYCGTGEITRYDLDNNLTNITRRRIYQNNGSGEDSFIADVDNDGAVEYLTCDSYRNDLAKVRIFEFDASGEIGAINTSTNPGRIVLNGYGSNLCFNCSLEIGDVDNDGENELIVEWKRKETELFGTIIGYKISPTNSIATPAYTFMYEDTDLDDSFNEKMMIVADADNDGKNELIVTTRGEWKGNRLGYVFMFKVLPGGTVEKTLLADFYDGKGDSLWPAVGDADNDGKNEVIIATGVGNRGLPGTSHLILIEKQ